MDNQENPVKEPEVENPGDCIGHWLEGDTSCSICEIEESCKKMTQEINSEEKK